MKKFATPNGNKKIKIDLKNFIELYNQKKAILLDIRMDFETKIYSIPFALHIPADKIDEIELPKDKIIVVACPTQNRSPFMASYLIKKGYQARYLEKGLLHLIEYLKGEKAKQLQI